MIGDSRRLEGAERETSGEWKKGKMKGEERTGGKKHVIGRKRV